MPNRPPKEWWDRKYDEVKKGNPDYSDEQVRKTVGDIWYHKMSPGKKQKETKKSEGSVAVVAGEREGVIDGFADALFTSSWADFQEEQGESFSGIEILDVSPETPQEVISFAGRKISEIESANNVNFSDFIPPGEEEGSFSPWELGWYLGMQYLGHGVSWMDDHEDHGLKIPYGEFLITFYDPENNQYDFYMEGVAKKAQEENEDEENEDEENEDEEENGEKEYVVNISFSTITEESVAEGDYAEHGFEEEDIEFESIEDIAHHIVNNYNFQHAEWSGIPPSPGDWISLTDDEPWASHTNHEDVIGITYGVHFTTNGEDGLSIEDMRTLSDILGVYGMKSTGKTAQAQEQYRAVITLAPSGDVIYGEWDVAPETAQTIGEERAKDLVDTGMAMSYTITLEKSSGGAEAGQPLMPNIEDIEWEQALEQLKGSKKRGAGFPLFSRDAEEYIRLQTLDEAAAQGDPVNATQAHAFIDAAIPKVVEKLTKDLGPEVRRVIESQRVDIFNDLTRGLLKDEPGARPAAPATPPPPLQTETVPELGVQPAAASTKKAIINDNLRDVFDNSYAYDAIATLLRADLGNEFTKQFKADELIDEEEFILDAVQNAFPEIPRSNLSQAFGDVLTDSYQPSNK